MYRQQRAALCIQRNWRRYQARKAFLLYRRRVVRLQCAWRSKLARRELRKRRASQREAGKLLQVCSPHLTRDVTGMTMQYSASATIECTIRPAR